MQPIYISRLLMLLFFINEAVVVVRSKPEERASITVPPLAGLSGVLILVPFFFTLELPIWLAWLAVILQLGGLGLEVASELQLMRAKSFAISSQAATAIQKHGVYRWLENPIYVGIILQLVGWAVWMPLIFLMIALFFPVLRTMVSNERQFLASKHNVTHRGLDSFIWN